MVEAANQKGCMWVKGLLIVASRGGEGKVEKQTGFSPPNSLWFGTRAKSLLIVPRVSLV